MKPHSMSIALLPRRTQLPHHNLLHPAPASIASKHRLLHFSVPHTAIKNSPSASQLFIYADGSTSIDVTAFGATRAPCALNPFQEKHSL